MSVYVLDPALYEHFYRWKDYAGEAAALTQLLAAEGVAAGSRVLEAACGPGTHLTHLAHAFEVAGFDLSQPMVDLARRRLPGARLWQADMAAAALPEGVEPYDAALCLFSSLGYLHPDRLPGAVEAFAGLVRPGGVLAVEPWLMPEDIDPGRPFVQAVEEEDPLVTRASVLTVHGRATHLDMHWLVAPRGGPVRHLADPHVLYTTSLDELMAVFGARFEVRWNREGLSGRGLLVGRRR